MRLSEYIAQWELYALGVKCEEVPYIAAAAGARVFVYISRHLLGCLRLSGVQNTLIFTSRITLCW